MNCCALRGVKKERVGGSALGVGVSEHPPLPPMSTEHFGASQLVRLEEHRSGKGRQISVRKSHRLGREQVLR